MKYYYLVTGLPELSIDDNKLSLTTADFKTEIYPLLSEADRGLIDLFYLQYDNEALLRVLYDVARRGTKSNADAAIEVDPRGLFTAEELTERVTRIRDGERLKESELPAYMSAFVEEYLTSNSEDNVALQNRLSSLYYAYAMKADNKFVSDWFKFNLTVNNLLVALTARKYKMEVAPLIVGDTEVCEALRTSNARDFGLADEVDALETLIKVAETDELLEREKKLDRLRWDWMTDATFFDYFSIERLFVFLLQLQMIERWMNLDRETGQKLFRSLVDGLKDEVKIPDLQ